MTELLETCGGWVGGLLILLLAGVELAPIKVSPLRWLGNRLNADLKAEIKAVKTDLDAFQLEVGGNQVKQKRGEILRFFASLRRNEHHTKEEFDHIIGIHDDYMKLLEKLGKQNGQVDAAYKWIIAIYDECVGEGKFIA